LWEDKEAIINNFSCGEMAWSLGRKEKREELIY
jgi:hypothetical protein